MATVATFDLVPEFVFTDRRRYKNVQSPRDLGPVHRRDIWDADLEVYELYWRMAKDGEVQRLKALWDLTSQGIDEMTYTPPGGGAKTVIFASPFVFTRVGPDLNHIEAKLAEVR